MNKKENKFHIVYTTEEDTKNEIKKLISQITEDEISIFSFKGESLYQTGHGHCFVYGFYVEYITKTGIRATQYASGLWKIGADDYRFNEGEFVLIPKAKSHTIDWGTLSFPVVKQVNAKTIANDLQSIKPKR